MFIYLTALTCVYGYCRNYVRLVKNYYASMKAVDDYRMDLAWLRGGWSSMTPMKHQFLEEAPASPAVLSREVAQLFRQSPLSRTFVIPSGPAGRSVTSTLRHIVGKLARSKRLNDAVMDAALWHVSTYCKTCYAIDAISVTNEKRFVPDFSLASCNYVLVPIHMAALKHWIIQIVEIQMADPDTSKHKIWVTFYDPLGVASSLDVYQAKWISFTLPLLQQWFDRDQDREKLRKWVSNLVTTKRQINSGDSKAVTTTGPNDDGAAPMTSPCSLPEIVAVPVTTPSR